MLSDRVLGMSYLSSWRNAWGSGEMAEKGCKPPRFVYDALGGQRVGIVVAGGGLSGRQV
jgi:hypothetical protein